MTSPLLTIAIPTYNRSAHLDFLLGALARETRGLHGGVRILVSDNASPDDTASVIDLHRGEFEDFLGLRNDENIGADRNVETCFHRSTTEYVWIIGDDDVPLPGAIAQLLQHLNERQPDLLYLPSLVSRDVPGELPRQPSVVASWGALSREQIAAVVHVQFTFLSGVVFRKGITTPASIEAALARTRGSNLGHLAWTFEILRLGQRFSVCRRPMLMANAGNRGGYAVLDVFLVNHTRLVLDLLEECPLAARNILRRTSLCHLPGLIWNLRTHRLGEFDLPRPETIRVPLALSQRLGYRWLVLPVWKFPKPVAAIYFQCSRIVSRAIRAYDQYVVSRSFS